MLADNGPTDMEEAGDLSDVVLSWSMQEILGAEQQVRWFHFLGPSPDPILMYSANNCVLCANFGDVSCFVFALKPCLDALQRVLEWIG
jgi:hypothetical protein